MNTHPNLEAQLARLEDTLSRAERRSPQAVRTARRVQARSVRSAVKRLTTMGVAIVALLFATIGFAFIVGPIGIGGLFVVAAAIVFMLIFFSVYPTAKPEAPVDVAKTPTPEIVHRLESYLHRNRSQLPAPAARKVDAISAQLPLLESRLATIDLLDPLAQDARRLMGKHLPDLIDRYERVPASFRNERDAEGMTVHDRLLSGLDAAREAIDDISAKLTRDDLNAFETQTRFIETRYRDGGATVGDETSKS